MKQINGKLRQFHKENRGFTLAEMIVSFMLIGLFMVAASKVIINTASIYYEAKGTANGMQICSILTAKVRGEIEGAVTDRLRKTDENGDPTAEREDYAIYIGGDTVHTETQKLTSGIQLTNADYCHIYIGVNADGYLDIYYYGGEDTGEEKNGKSIETQETHWTFDKNTYLGYTIDSLEFEKASEEFNDNVIKMTLTVTSPRYGDYTVTEYIECYNFDKEASESSLIQWK